MVATALANRTATARSIALFCSTAREISTRPLDAELRARKIARAVPDIVEDALVFRLVPHDTPLHDLPPDRMGIPTPPATFPTVVLSRCDLVLVPGLVFDVGGGRLGYGRGYYDRALRDGHVDLDRCVAIFHDAQLVDSAQRVPMDDAHDVRMRWLCTPSRGLFSSASG